MKCDHAAVLTVTSHIPAHALVHCADTGAGRRGAEQSSKPRGKPAERKHVQLKLTAGGGAVQMVRPQSVRCGKKRQRAGAVTCVDGTGKKLRTLLYEPAVGKVRKRGTQALLPPRGLGESGGTKRKGRNKVALCADRNRMKRKSAAGFQSMQAARLAHCQSGDTNCVTHSAGGSLRVGDANSKANLSKTTMRPVD